MREKRKEKKEMDNDSYLSYRLSFCNEYLELVLPLVTGRLSRFAIRRLMDDFSSSKCMLSISFTTNLGNLRRCN